MDFNLTNIKNKLKQSYLSACLTLQNKKKIDGQALLAGRYIPMIIYLR